MVAKYLLTLFLALPLFVAADPIPSKYQIKDPGFEAEALQKFNSFVAEYNKQYKNEEEFKQRFSIFKDNLQKIDQLNKEREGTTKYSVNQFSDLTYDEFAGSRTSRITKKELKNVRRPALQQPKEEIEFSTITNDGTTIDGTTIDGTTERTME